jgi:hypothetical protein
MSAQPNERNAAWIAAVEQTADRVEHGMDDRFTHVEQCKHRVQMLLGVFLAKGVLPLEFKPAHSVGDLLTQHLDELEQEAERKGGVLQTLSDQFAKIYKAAPALHSAA